MSPETRKFLDIYLALREKHLDNFGRYHSDLPIELRQEFEKAWNCFADAIGAPHLAQALYERAALARKAKVSFAALCA